MQHTLSWGADWAWSLPLVIVTLTFHVTGLAFINARLNRILHLNRDHPRFFSFFVLVMGLTALLATILHACEAGLWAVLYLALGAIPDYATAMLYSLSAITTYGHAEVYLAPRWQLMGAVEALNGLLLFGLTTAFLYGHLQRVWPLKHERVLRDD